MVVPVYESGSPKEADRQRPGPDKRDQPAPWRPARAILPGGIGKALVEFLRRCAAQEQALREFMKPDAAMMREWWSTGRVAF